jgi:long-chain fatty acid transport protein
MYKPIRTLVSSAVLAVIASTTAQAGGFSLYTESNGYSVGNFGAGVAAEARDASTAWFNPAGLALIHDQQAVFGGVGVFPTSKVSGRTVYTTPNPAVPGTVLTYRQTFNNIDGAENAFVPSFHYARPLTDTVTFGLSLVSPFGLSTLWDSTTPVRYAAEKSELLVVNLSPSIGGKLTEHFFLGAGIDLQYAKVKFNQYLGSPALASFISTLQTGINNPTGLDSLSYNKGHSTGVGFHAGGMLVFNDNHTRVGLNYESKVKHKFNGYSELRGPLANTATNVLAAATWANGTFRVNNLQSNRIEFPEVVTLSAYQDVNERVALLGSVVFTGWNVLRTIQLKNVAASGVSTAPAGQVFNVVANSSSSENYRNAWRGALGANVKVNEKLMVTFGGGYDQTPTRDAFRTVRLPDDDRWALSVGGHYQARPDIGVDVGYTYLWAANKPPINKTQFIGTSTFNVNGRADAHAHLLGGQIVWKMDGVDEKPAMKK